jgi:hypothetical protein
MRSGWRLAACSSRASPKDDEMHAGLTRRGNKADDNCRQCAPIVFSLWIFVWAEGVQHWRNGVRVRVVNSVISIPGLSCRTSLNPPYHGLVRFPLFFFKRFSPGEAQGPLFYPRGFLPSFPRFCTKWPLLCRFLTQLPGSRISCHPLVYIPPTVKRNAVQLCLDRVCPF